VPFTGGGDLYGRVEQADELGGRIAGDAVVKALGRLGGKDQTQPVLAGLRG